MGASAKEALRRMLEIGTTTSVSNNLACLKYKVLT
jgi:hypothetical protein